MERAIHPTHPIHFDKPVKLANQRYEFYRCHSISSIVFDRIGTDTVVDGRQTDNVYVPDLFCEDFEVTSR